MANWSRRQPGRVTALEALFPDLTFDCCIQDNGFHPVLFQTISFCGSRAACARFAPAEAFGRNWYVDEYGDRWKVERRRDGRYFGILHSDRDTPDLPKGARRWPQVGLAKEVNRMLRRVLAKRRPETQPERRAG